MIPWLRQIWDALIGRNINKIFLYSVCSFVWIAQKHWHNFFSENVVWTVVLFCLLFIITPKIIVTLYMCNIQALLWQKSSSEPMKFTWQPDTLYALFLGCAEKVDRSKKDISSLICTNIRTLSDFSVNFSKSILICIFFAHIESRDTWVLILAHLTVIVIGNVYYTWVITSG